jgi:hypothetical protein
MFSLESLPFDASFEVSLSFRVQQQDWWHSGRSHAFASRLAFVLFSTFYAKSAFDFGVLGDKPRKNVLMRKHLAMQASIQHIGCRAFWSYNTGSVHTFRWCCYAESVLSSSGSLGRISDAFGYHGLQDTALGRHHDTFDEPSWTTFLGPNFSGMFVGRKL